MALSQIIAARHQANYAGKAKSEGRFIAGGGHIYGPNGQLFVPIGANLGTTLAFDWKGTAKTHAVDAVTWGWNCIRLNILATDTISYSYLKTFPGLASFLNYLDTIIAEYTALHIVVMLEAHDNPKTSGYDQDAVEGKMVAFWQAAAAKWASNPYVWYNLINEPAYTNGSWVALHHRLAAAIRGAGAWAPIVVDAPGWGQDAGYLSPYFTDSKYAYETDMAPALQQRWGNTVVSNHNYGAKWDTYAKTVAWITSTRASGLAPIFGEFGYAYDGTSTAGSYALNYSAAKAVVQASKEYGVGALVWHGTHGDNYSMTADGTAFWHADPSTNTNTSELGYDVWSLTHA